MKQNFLKLPVLTNIRFYKTGDSFVLYDDENNPNYTINPGKEEYWVLTETSITKNIYRNLLAWLLEQYVDHLEAFEELDHSEFKKVHFEDLIVQLFCVDPRPLEIEKKSVEFRETVDFKYILNGLGWFLHEYINVGDFNVYEQEGNLITDDIQKTLSASTSSNSDYWEIYKKAEGTKLFALNSFLNEVLKNVQIKNMLIKEIPNIKPLTNKIVEVVDFLFKQEEFAFSKRGLELIKANLRFFSEEKLLGIFIKKLKDFVITERDLVTEIVEEKINSRIFSIFYEAVSFEAKTKKILQECPDAQISNYFRFTKNSDNIFLVLFRMLKMSDINCRQMSGDGNILHGFDNDIILEFAIALGANPNFKNLKGETALTRFCFFSKKSLTLIRNGADVNIQNNFGDTVLHSLCRYLANYYEELYRESLILAESNQDDIKIINTLDDWLEFGVDIKIENNAGKTAIWILEDKVQQVPQGNERGFLEEHISFIKTKTKLLEKYPPKLTVIGPVSQEMAANRTRLG